MSSSGKAAAAEAIGTAFLVAAVVGSGIMGERLAGGNAAIALLANTVATGAALLCLILAFGPVSGAHFNPVVTLVLGGGRADPSRAAAYIAAQIAGGLAGVTIAHVMFQHPVLVVGVAERAGAAQVFSEFIATFGLIAVIAGCSRATPEYTPFAVAAYITAAYWFTASTSFANPAVTIARSLTDTFSGIRPVDVPAFVAAQLAGGVAAASMSRWVSR
jgi:glycerol uptake facilitator-like aquaporin